MNKYKIWLFFFLTMPVMAYGQEHTELEQLIEQALNNNKTLESLRFKVESSKANMGTAFDFEKTNVYLGYDENNIAPNEKALWVMGIEQSFAFPTVYGVSRRLYRSQWEQQQAAYEIEKNKLALDVARQYEQVVYLQQKEKLYRRLDSLYHDFSKAGNRRFELGETNYLEKITAEAKARQVHTTLLQLLKQKEAGYDLLKSLIQADDSMTISKDSLEVLVLQGSTGRELQDDYMEKVSNMYEFQLKQQNQNWLPDINIEFFTGTNKGLGYNQNGFQVGLSLPVFFTGNVARRKTAKLEVQSWESQRNSNELVMERFYRQKQAELEGHMEMIKYYSENGKSLSREIIKTADMSYRNGEIDYFQYIQSMENAADIEMEYMESILSYNKSYLELYYFNFNE